jgi:hypothetical protein
MLPLILALAGGYLIYEGLEDQPKQMKAGGEIPKDLKVGDFVMVKKEIIREKGTGDHLWTKKDLKGVVVKNDDGLYQIHKVDTKDKEIKYPKGLIGYFYKKDLYLPEKMAEGGSIDDQMKDAMSKRDAIEKEIRQLMTEEPKDFDKIEALKHEYDSLGKAYKKLNKQKLDEMRGGLKFK